LLNIYILFTVNFYNNNKFIIFILNKLKSGQNLLKFEVFVNAIKKCDVILKPYGINITNILTKIDEKVRKCIICIYWHCRYSGNILYL